MSSPPSFTPEELAAAVASSHSWRGVLRELGRNSTSAGTFRAVRRRVETLGIDHSHFTGQRRWSDRQLAEAASTATSWSEVAKHLGLSASGNTISALRGHALRLSLNVSHLTAPSPPLDTLFGEAPHPDRLRIAAASFAAGWFQLRGYEVLWPQEGCRYDLVAVGAHGFSRIQVKSTTYRQGNSRMAMISGTRRGERVAYDVGEVELFFILDDNLDAYLIPFASVAGLSTISLNKYGGHRVAEGGRWLEVPVNAGVSP